MLHPSSLFVCYIWLYFCWKFVNKLKTPVWGCTKIPQEHVTDMEFGLNKTWRGLDAFIVIGDSGVDASRCKDELQCFWCRCTVVFLPEDQSRQLWHHEMMSQGSHAILGGHYKRRAHMKLRAVIWIFWYWTFGSTNKSQTLYSGYLSCLSWSRA